MVNKYEPIIPEQLLRELTRQEILTYYILRTYEGEWISPSNKELGEIIKVDPTSVARSIKGLRNKKYVEATYKKTGDGTIRKIRLAERKPVHEK